MKYKLILATLLSTSLLLAAASAQTYQVTDIGTAPLGRIFPAGINASGQVVGYSLTSDGNAYHAFLYDGTMHDLGTLGTNSYASGINDSGRVTGTYEAAGSTIHPFLYDGAMHDLGTLGSGSGINATGQVTGTSFNITGQSAIRAFLYTPGAQPLHNLGTLGGSESFGIGINASGKVTGYANTIDGYRAFLYDGAMHDLGVLGGNDSRGYAINASGQITGVSTIAGNAESHAFLYDGTMHDLGTLGGTYSQGNGINAFGQIVGYSGGDAFLYDAVHGMVDLNTLIDPLPGWALTDASAINDAGQIVGTGINSDGDIHAILLTPVPEPSAVVLVGMAITCLAMIRRQYIFSFTIGLLSKRNLPGRVCIGAAGLLISVVVTASTAPAKEYHLTDLGTLGGAESSAAHINSSGVIVGTSNPTASTFDHAFIFDGNMSDLGTLTGFSSSASSINDSGQVVGASPVNGESPFRAFLYDGTMHGLGTLGGLYSEALDINSSGKIVGNSDLANNNTHAFLYDGVMHDLGTLGGTISSANSINSSGKIAGQAWLPGDMVAHAFVYNGAMHDLGTLGGASSDAFDINSSGNIVGYSEIGATTHAFLFDTTMHDLGTLGGFSEALAINASGQVVGDSDISSGNFVRHAFLYSGGAMTDLNTLLDASGTGWTLQFAYDINDSGWIVGRGSNPDGSFHGYLLTPVPEPSTSLLAVLGVICLLACRGLLISKLLRKSASENLPIGIYEESSAFLSARGNSA